MSLAVSLERLLSKVLTPAQVALVGLAVNVAHMIGHAFVVLEALIAEGTGVA